MSDMMTERDGGIFILANFEMRDFCEQMHIYSEDGEVVMNIGPFGMTLSAYDTRGLLEALKDAVEQAERFLALHSES